MEKPVEHKFCPFCGSSNIARDLFPIHLGSKSDKLENASCNSCRRSWIIEIIISLLLIPTLSIGQDFAMSIDDAALIWNEPHMLDSMVIEIDTVVTEIIWSEGDINCNHDWCWMPQLYNLYERANNKSIERICRICLQYETYERTIRFRLVRKEESEFWKLLNKVHDNSN